MDGRMDGTRRERFDDVGPRRNSAERKGEAEERLQQIAMGRVKGGAAERQMLGWPAS